MQTIIKHKLGIIGIRDYKDGIYDDYNHIAALLDDYARRTYDGAPFSVVTGGSKGVESLAVTWAEKNNVPLRKLPPSITRYGRVKAFVVRNSAIIAESTEVAFFWDGSVPLVADAITAATAMGRRSTIFPLI